MKMVLPRRVMPEIASGPMADLAMLIIIFFMITAVFSSHKGIDYVLPKGDHSGVAESAVWVRVDVQGRIWLNRELLGQNQLANLGSLVRDALVGRQGRPVILQTDPEARYSQMMAVMNQLISRNPGMNLQIPSKLQIKLYRSIQ